MHVEWSMQHAFWKIQTAFDEIYAEIEVPGLIWFFRGPVALWSRINRFGKKPSDRLGQQIARAMQQTGEQRDRIPRLIYNPESEEEPLGGYEYTIHVGGVS